MRNAEKKITEEEIQKTKRRKKDAEKKRRSQNAEKSYFGLRSFL